jgi:hypothetical protein
VCGLQVMLSALPAMPQPFPAKIQVLSLALLGPRPCSAMVIGFMFRIQPFPANSIVVRNNSYALSIRLDHQALAGQRKPEVRPATTKLPCIAHCHVAKSMQIERAMCFGAPHVTVAVQESHYRPCCWIRKTAYYPATDNLQRPSSVRFTGRRSNGADHSYD